MSDEETSAQAYNRLRRAGWVPPEIAAQNNAEIERLRKEIKLVEASRFEIIQIDEERVAEIERLKAEIKRLRVIKP